MRTKIADAAGRCTSVPAPRQATPLPIRARAAPLPFRARPNPRRSSRWYSPQKAWLDRHRAQLSRTDRQADFRARKEQRQTSGCAPYRSPAGNFGDQTDRDDIVREVFRLQRGFDGTRGSDAKAISDAAAMPASTCRRAHTMVTEFLNQAFVLFHIFCMSPFSFVLSVFALNSNPLRLAPPPLLASALASPSPARSIELPSRAWPTSRQILAMLSEIAGIAAARRSSHRQGLPHPTNTPLRSLRLPSCPRFRET